MQSKWTSHLLEEDQERFKKEIYSSKRVLERLAQICDEEEKDLFSAETNYDTPNWEYRQADANGYKRCLRRIKLLADLDQRIIRLK